MMIGTEVGMLSNNTIVQYSNSVFGIADCLLFCFKTLRSRLLMAYNHRHYSFMWANLIDSVNPEVLPSLASQTQLKSLSIASRLAIIIF